MRNVFFIWYVSVYDFSNLAAKVGKNRLCFVLFWGYKSEMHIDAKSIVKQCQSEGYVCSLPHENSYQTSCSWKAAWRECRFWGFRGESQQCRLASLGVWKHLCNGTLTIVRSVLHAVQRYLSNCQKPIARCATVPCQLSEAHCKLQSNAFIMRLILPISEIDALFPELVEGRIEKFICKNL